MVRGVEERFKSVRSRKEFLDALIDLVWRGTVTQKAFPLIVSLAIEFGLDTGALADRCSVDVSTVIGWGDTDKEVRPDQKSCQSITSAILDQMKLLHRAAGKERLKVLITGLKGDPSPREFQEALDIAADLGISSKKIAEAIGTGQANTDRWVNKTLVPYPGLRRQVVTVINNLL